MNTNTCPPGVLTGYSHPKCYATGDRNCSSQISKEHFTSEVLLRQIQLNKTAKVSGLKWQQPETFNIVPLQRLASKILCERHYNSLDRLETSMGLFSEAIGVYDASLRSCTTAEESEQRQFSGDDIDRWMLKCLIGLKMSKNLISAQLRPEYIDLLFAISEWPEGWGLYFSPSPIMLIYHSPCILIETHVDQARGLVLAATFLIRGFPLMLCLGRPEDPTTIGLFRPEALFLKHSQCEKVLVLSWLGGPMGPPVVLERSGTYDGPPPNWKEWERNGCTMSRI